jgi:3-methyladenine DNA glycosylase AlkD
MSVTMPAPLDIPTEHAALVAQLRAEGRPYRGGIHNDSYSGSGRPFLNVGAPEMRRITRVWVAAHRTASAPQLIAMADSLFDGENYEEKILGALLLGYSRDARRAATPAMVDVWLDRLNGWAEIDSLCASVFGAEELANAWPAWRGLIERLGGDPNINKRRAALVLLTTPARTSDDPRFAELAFAVVERLKGERHILITKAVSWLLRSMTARHGPVVAAYLDAEAASLPAVAVRETQVKLRTGTKSGRSARR